MTPREVRRSDFTAASTGGMGKTLKKGSRPSAVPGWPVIINDEDDDHHHGGNRVIVQKFAVGLVMGGVSADGEVSERRPIKISFYCIDTRQSLI